MTPHQIAGSYPPDLYKGTAEYYERFRPPYPPILFDDLRKRVPINGVQRLLDLACGTGQIAFSLASEFIEVVAIDQEAEFIDLAKHKAAGLGMNNIGFMVASAEHVDLHAQFDLVTIGNAFHRLDRNLVAQRLTVTLQHGGCVALLWGDTPWQGQQPWQQDVAETLNRWQHRLESTERVPEGWKRSVDRYPHAEVLRGAGFTYEGRFEFAVSQQWSIESLIGFIYSTSFLNRTVLQQYAEEFENDLQERLLGFGEYDSFRQDAIFAYELARME